MLLLVVISRGRNLESYMVIMMLSEMHVDAQVCIFDVPLEKKKGEKRSEANPRSSKQWKSFRESNNYSFLCFHRFAAF